MTTFVFIAAGTGSQLAGGDVIAIEIGKMLLRTGHRLIIVTSQEGKESWERAGVLGEFWIFDVPIRREVTLLGDALHLGWQMAKATACIIKKRLKETTVVFSTSDMLIDVLPGVFLKGPNVRRIALLHMVNPSPFRGYRGAFGDSQPQYRIDMRAGLNYVQQRISILCLRKWYDLVMTQAPYNRRFLERKPRAGQIAPFDLPYGIDWELINSLPESEKTYDACWMGRSHPQKGLTDLLHIWNLVRREKPEARLALIGNVAAPLAPLLNKLGLEKNAHCLGYLDGREKFSILKQSKLFVFPSHFEGRPVAIAEALACGLPVVAYDLPVYDGAYSRGMLTSPIGDIQGMAAHILRFLDDEEKRHQLSEEARNSVAEYDWHKSAHCLVKAARIALERPGRAAKR